MPSTDRPLLIEAVAPGHLGLKIHLHARGYQPGRKTRSVDAAQAMCSAYISPKDHRVPLSEALQWPDRLPTALDTRPQRRWCLSCIGHAAEVLGLTGHFVTQLAAHAQDASRPHVS